MEKMCVIDGFVLVGGASSRMKRDKAYLLLGGKTFVERAALSLQAIAPKNVSIVGNLKRNSIDLPILPDAVNKNKRAALIGLQAALLNSKTIWTAILACDLPFVSGELFERLIGFATEMFDAVVPIQKDGKPQPLCALYRREVCLPSVEEMLENDNWRLQDLLSNLKTRLVKFEETCDLQNAEYFFLNINTPEDYKKARRIAAAIEN